MSHDLFFGPKSEVVRQKRREKTRKKTQEWRLFGNRVGCGRAGRGSVGIRKCTTHPRDRKFRPDLHTRFDAVDPLPCGFGGAERQAVAAAGEQVRLDAHAGLLAGVDEHQRVLIRHAIVRNGMPDEHRRRLRVDMLFDRNRVERFRIGLAVAEQRIETAAVGERAGRDHRVGEHQAVRAHRIRVAVRARSNWLHSNAITTP